MKNVTQAKRRYVSTIFLMSIIFATVIAKEKRQQDVLNVVDINNKVEKLKERRSPQFSICHHGKCSRRRSGKRGMQKVGRELRSSTS